MNQHEAGRFANAALRELTLGTDGWPLAWCHGCWTTHGNKGSFHEGQAWFDRDRCELDRALQLVREVEARFRRAHPTVEPLRLFATPTTRLGIALSAVRDHFEDIATREADKMRRDGESWVFVSEVTTRVGWRVGEDRVIVELVSESSVDELPAQRLGEAWLAVLAEQLPEITSIVEVIGSSH